MSGLTIQPAEAMNSLDPAPGKKNEPARVKHAAEQFEALMIGQMMKSIREAEESGPMAEEKDQAGSSALQLAEEQFAHVLASRGGLGLASVFTKAFPAKDSSSGQIVPGPHSPARP